MERARGRFFLIGRPPTLRNPAALKFMCRGNERFPGFFFFLFLNKLDIITRPPLLLYRRFALRLIKKPLFKL